MTHVHLPSLSVAVALALMLGTVPSLIAASPAALPPAADAKPAPAKPAEPRASAAKAPTPRPAVAPPAPAAPARPVVPGERELHVVVTVEAAQEWKKNDPKYPGEQWSKGSTKQRYEMRTRLRTDGRLEVRHLLDPDMDTRLDAKTVQLARAARKYFERPGQPLRIPTDPAEKKAIIDRLKTQYLACNADRTCDYENQMQFAAIQAAFDNPELLEEDEEPGQYLYYLPYAQCPSSSRVTLTMAIDGVRYNKDSDKFVPFKERRSADTVDATEGGLALCRHYLAVIDTKDPDRPMWQETIFIPRPIGMTEYTENNHTAREEQPQPMPTAVLDWMTETLRHAPTQGKASVTLPLPLALNGNQTVLGLFTGTAEATMEWSFREVSSAGAPSRP